jgi:hypothetical protein
MCDCIDDVNKHLAKHNTRIMLPIWTGNGVIKPFVETEKVDTKKRGKPRRMFAAHCPFCGEKYATGSRAAEQSLQEQR